MRIVNQLRTDSPWLSYPSLHGGIAWIFPSNLDLKPHANLISGILDPFLTNWTAHGAAVEADAALVHGHFLVVVEGNSGEASSGCSQDALRSVISQLEASLKTSLLSGGRLFYQGSDEHVVVVDRVQFQNQAKTGLIGPETLVFDTLVNKAADIREGAFLLPARASWHRKLLPTAQAVSRD